MARIRSIKPDFFRHEGLQDLEAANPGAYPMLVFAGLWGHCDKLGRFEWKPRHLKLDILPFLDFDIEKTLSLLESAGFIQRYTVGEKQFGLIPSWEIHQRISGKEAQDDAKSPEPQSRSKREAPKKQSVEQEGKGREEEGKGMERGASDAAPSQSQPKSKGTRLAENWEPSPADRAYAVDRGVDYSDEAENFRDYWLAKPGSGGVKLDWSRTWKRWVRTAAEGRGKGKSYASGTSTPRRGLSAAILDVAADFQRRSERGHGNPGVHGDGLTRGYGEGQDDLGGSPETDGDGGIIEGICEDVEPDAAPAGRGNGTGDSVPGTVVPGTGGRGSIRASEVARTEPMVPDMARTEGDDRHTGGATAEDARGPDLVAEAPRFIGRVA